jgi:hypothetical protein
MTVHSYIRSKCVAATILIPTPNVRILPSERSSESAEVFRVRSGTCFAAQGWERTKCPPLRDPPCVVQISGKAQGDAVYVRNRALHPEGLASHPAAGMLDSYATRYLSALPPEANRMDAMFPSIVRLRGVGNIDARMGFFPQIEHSYRNERYALSVEFDKEDGR